MRQKLERKTETPSFPLTMVEAGRRVRICRIFGGPGLQRRLSAMGLTADMEIDIVRNDRGGPLVIKVLDSRFIIGRGMAHHVMIR